MMKRRLYYIFPNETDIRQVVDELLLKRVPVTDMHVIGPPNVDLGDLPQASVLQRNDAVRGSLIGMTFGGIVGLAGGLIGHYIVDMAVGGAVIATTVVGALVGAWGAGLIASSAPNARLRRFQKELTDGRYLLMLDISKEDAESIDSLIKKSHPDAGFEGIEPTIPKFP